MTTFILAAKCDFARHLAREGHEFADLTRALLSDGVKVDKKRVARLMRK